MKLCLARIAKNISYFLVPIFIVLLIASIAGLAVMDTEVGLKNTNNYYETKLFSDRYFNNTFGNFRELINFENIIANEEEIKTYEQAKNKTENSSIKSYNQFDYYYQNSGYADMQKIQIDGKPAVIYYTRDNFTNFQYLVLNKDLGVAITNLEHTMKTDTIEEIKEVLSQNDIYWNYQKNQVSTNIPNLAIENIRYTYQFEQILDGANNKEIYTVLLNDLPYNDEYAITKLGYEAFYQTKTMAPILIPFSVVMLIVLGIFIISGIGKTATKQGIYLNWFDRWKLEIVLLIGIFIIGIGVSSFAVIESNIRTVIITGISIGSIIIYLGCILMLETIVKRIKARTLFKSTILYSIYRGIRKLINNRKIATKLSLIYGGFCLAEAILIAGAINSDDEQAVGFNVVLLMTLLIGTFVYLFKELRNFQKIEKALYDIYQGNTGVYLNSNEMKGVLKKLCIYIDDIAGGLSNALEQSLKSERLKTELITNVSHDIKTPLTSIINYVDLLKKEKMPNEKCTEYLMILDNKSQRLKKLTEDLVEASKASSGNIKLNLEQINVKELIKQVSGEFEDRFKQKELEEIMTLPEQEVWINADGRYMYRTLENIYSNCAKYALENTRVYVDVVLNKNSVVIQMKNVSKEKLNITSDELMERFVRGDSSRNTEGSGLGLSIARSLTELQKGKFHIYLDGDLFKVTLGFEILKK